MKKMLTTKEETVTLRRSQRILQHQIVKSDIFKSTISASTNLALKKKEESARTKSIKRKNNVKSLDLDDCTCSICINVLIEPVSLPCKHEFCLNCIFNPTNAEIYFTKCPLCRKLIPGSFLREKNRSKLVNASRWTEIKSNFGKEIMSKNEQNWEFAMVDLVTKLRNGCLKSVLFIKNTIVSFKLFQLLLL
jgi:hypothetical protein